MTSAHHASSLDLEVHAGHGLAYSNVAPVAAIPEIEELHIGHAVVLSKLREFQDAGHTVVLIIGDYTARVGDPSGKSKSRPVVEGAQIDQNALTYQDQVFRILDRERTEVRWNGEWFARMPIGRPFQGEIEMLLAQIPRFQRAPQGKTAATKKRGGFMRR